MRGISPALFCFILVNGCGGGGGEEQLVVSPQFDGSQSAVENIYSEEQISALEEIGLNINLGGLPPDIQGTFRIEPMVLQATTVPDDPGVDEISFSPANLTFSGQDNLTLTVNLEMLEDQGAVTNGTGSFLSGMGQAFTVYFVSETTVDGQVADTTITFSGVMSDQGIENLQFAGFMLDDRDDIFNLFIPNDTGRLLIDLDGFSQRIPIEAVDANVNFSSALSIWR